MASSRRGSRKQAPDYPGPSNGESDSSNNAVDPTAPKPPPGPPFPSPLRSDGGSQNASPVKGHFHKQDEVVGLSRWGPERRTSLANVRGLANPRNYLCYTNSVLTLLMHLDPFVGYLNRVHTGTGEPPASDLLTLLDDFSRAYWQTVPYPDIEYPAQQVRRYVRNIPEGHGFGVEPFIPTGGEEVHEDAADWLNKILEICSAQVRHGRELFGEGHGEVEAANFGALIEPVFQKHKACRGTGTICPGKKIRVKGGIHGSDTYSPVIPVGVEEDSGTLESAISKVMKYDTELYCKNCAKADGYQTKLGRFWNSFVETPEILFFKINRYKYVDGAFRRVRYPLAIPEDLYLDQLLDRRAVQAGATAEYYLSGVISHKGGLEGGHYVSFVRYHAHRQNWIRISDDDVRWSELDEAIRAPAAAERYNNGFFPYLLAYTKVSHGQEADGITGPIEAVKIDSDSSDEESEVASIILDKEEGTRTPSWGGFLTWDIKNRKHSL